MPKFTINYEMTCSGTLEIEAASLSEAEAQVENMPLSILGREAEGGSVEILREDEDAEDDSA